MCHHASSSDRIAHVIAFKRIFCHEMANNDAARAFLFNSMQEAAGDVESTREKEQKSASDHKEAALAFLSVSACHHSQFELIETARLL